MLSANSNSIMKNSSLKENIGKLIKLTKNEDSNNVKK